MQPLSPSFKAACFFYLGFAAILLMVNLGYASGLTAQVVSPTDQADRIRLSPEQLIDFNNDIFKLWHQVLREKSDQSLFKEQETKLRTKKVFGSYEISWAFTKERIELPVALSEADLVTLGLEWKKLAQKQGMNSPKLAWGYNDNRLWLKIYNDVQVITGTKRLTVPIAELLIIQPLTETSNNEWDWRGLFPKSQPDLHTIAEKPVDSKPIVSEDKSKKTDTKPKTEIPKPIIPKEGSQIASNSKPLVLPPLIDSKPVPKPVQPSIPLPVKPKAKVAIIIDDVGFVREPADRMLQVPTRLTWAILPLSPYGIEYAKAAFERGFEIILHQPLEPLDTREDPGPGLIRRDWTPDEIRRQFELNISGIPYIKGINNHMGSAGTMDEYLMEQLMQLLKEKKLFFIDSFTSNKSVAGRLARKHAVPFGKRAIFIDHYSDYNSKKQALRQLIKVALKNGTAIGIGHVRDGTAEAIEEMLPEFIKAGIEIVPVSELVR
ncbi:MAG TPA: divergent polysaccharide deacetylase family protein [Bacillota bacterium]|jgi:polysaccharide deacetylase 2 family uncharacterized protein YibQ|nr:divergent polysaccharide deacetylase family protein [Bacillota bacterium]HOL09255.1 divergent polysaccharide deacetylase family protein [Bacillota bacterium]HPO96918.1 divergent polysaccharide deacetylase family protein [Bacillota bacterium]